MPKRKFTDQDYEKLCKKLRKIEKKVQRDKISKRRRRILSSSSSSSSADDSHTGQSQNHDRIRSEAEPTNPEQNEDSDAQPEASLDAAAGGSNAPPSEEPSTSETPPAAEAGLNATLENSTLELDAEILQILGVDPTQSEKYGKAIQKDLAVRFEHTATVGLLKEDRKELMDKYLVPKNCKMVGAPVLNPEIKAALSEAVIKRDAVIESKQKLMASAIASLGEAITSLLSSKDKNPELLRILMDTGRTMCDCQHNDTVTRRNFIIFAVKKYMKESLQNAKIDTFLFGQDLSETLKAAKAINKSGAELKPIPAPKPSTSRANLPNASKNWRNFNPVRPAAAALASSKAKETSRAAPATKNQRGNYSRRSHSQRASYSRR